MCWAFMGKKGGGGGGAQYLDLSLHLDIGMAQVVAFVLIEDKGTAILNAWLYWQIICNCCIDLVLTESTDLCKGSL